MRVTVELGPNDHVESVNNSSVLARPELEATSTTRWDVRQDMNSFVVLFGLEKSVVEPLLNGSEMR